MAAKPSDDIILEADTLFKDMADYKKAVPDGDISYADLFKAFAKSASDAGVNLYPNPSPDQRWIKSQFYSDSWTKNPTLDEISNSQNPNVTGVCDSTDEDMALSVIRRLNLAGSFRYAELTALFATAFAVIPDPRKWLNPNAKDVPEPDVSSVSDAPVSEKSVAEKQEDSKAEQVQVEKDSEPAPVAAKSQTGNTDSKRAKG